MPEAQQTFTDIQPIQQTFTDVRPVSSEAPKPPSFWKDPKGYLQSRSHQLTQEAQNQVNQALGPESQGKPFLARLGHNLLSLGPETGALIDKLIVGGMDWKNAIVVSAGAVDPAIPAAYFGAHGAAQLTGVEPGVEASNTSPENVQNALLAASAVAGAGTAAGTPKSGAVARAAPSISKEIATTPIRLAARTVEAAVNQKVAPIRPIVRIMTPADEAGSLHINVPGRDIGLSKSAEPVLEKVSSWLDSEARTMPGQISPEVTAPRARTTAAPIPPRSGLALPPAPVGAELAESAGPAATSSLLLERSRAFGRTANRGQVAETFTGPSRTMPGQISPEVIRPPQAIAASIPARSGLALPPGPEEVAPVVAGKGEGLPRTLSGESALRQILTGQDNANLLKIARSRGINVTQEALLKPGTADAKLINKIIDHFSQDELDGISAQYTENTRFRHDFGDIGPEAWKTLSLKSYFPDLKIPGAVIRRTFDAVQKAAKPPSSLGITLPPGTTEEDLSPLLQESLKRAREARGSNK